MRRPSFAVRFLSSVCAGTLFLVSVAPASAARSARSNIAPIGVVAATTRETVSRADFLVRTIETLYGTSEKDYPISLSGVSEKARRAVGLAISAGALPGWERSPAWDAPVSRGHALHVLFTLATLSPPTPKNTRFRDVAPGEAGMVERAIAWDLFTPLTSTYFGWDRALQSGEFDHLLQTFASHLTLPLPQPSVTQAPDGARQRRQATTPAPAKSGKTPKKKSITIEFSIDPGSNRVLPRELPRQDLLSTIWGLIQSRYLHIENLKDEEIGYGLAEKLMSLLNDPYATFFPPSSAKAFQEQLQGKELSGIGAQVERHAQGGLVVVSPLTGSPALAAGVRPSDRITHVNGESILELSLEEAVAKIRGPAGTMVELTIDRNGSKIAITVVRAKISLPEIEVSRQDDVVVVKLYQFGERTIRDLGDMLEKEMATQPMGMVLDLRNNPGGLLDAAISVLGHFFAGGTTVAQVQTRSGTRAEVTRSGAPVVPASLPIIVLVNKGSASASEIVAGALQDLGRAKIMGAQTYGKGSVQEVTPVPSGESVKFTTGAWFTPNGRSIEKQGITPDIVRAEPAPGERDEWLREAVQLLHGQDRR